MTTRSTPSACTPWAARWARSSPASSPPQKSIGNLNTNLKDIVGKTLWLEQLKAIGVTLALAVVGTSSSPTSSRPSWDLRPDEEVETVGLDLAEHGEEGYHGWVGGSMHGGTTGGYGSFSATVEDAVRAGTSKKSTQPG